MIGVNEEVLSPEIEVGSLVVFRSPDDPQFARNEDDQEWQKMRFDAHPDPLMVRVRIGNQLVLVDPKNPSGGDIKFRDPSLHVGHVKLYKK